MSLYCPGTWLGLEYPAEVNHMRQNLHQTATGPMGTRQDWALSLSDSFHLDTNVSSCAWTARHPGADTRQRQ
jgi:hypothetical protein